MQQYNYIYVCCIITFENMLTMIDPCYQSRKYCEGFFWMQIFLYMSNTYFTNIAINFTYESFSHWYPFINEYMNIQYNNYGISIMQVKIYFFLIWINYFLRYISMGDFFSLPLYCFILSCVRLFHSIYFSLCSHSWLNSVDSIQCRI